MAQARCKKSTGKRKSLFNDADMRPKRGLLDLYYISLSKIGEHLKLDQARPADVQAIIDQLI